jgi:uncharacterized protein (UPF0548 family)
MLVDCYRNTNFSHSVWITVLSFVESATHQAYLANSLFKVYRVFHNGVRDYKHL